MISRARLISTHLPHTIDVSSFSMPGSQTHHLHHASHSHSAHGSTRLTAVHSILLSPPRSQLVPSPQTTPLSSPDPYHLHHPLRLRASGRATRVRLRLLSMPLIGHFAAPLPQHNLESDQHNHHCARAADTWAHASSARQEDGTPLSVSDCPPPSSLSTRGRRPSSASITMTCVYCGARAFRPRRHRARAPVAPPWRARAAPGRRGSAR